FGCAPAGCDPFGKRSPRIVRAIKNRRPKNDPGHTGTSEDNHDGSNALDHGIRPPRFSPPLQRTITGQLLSVKYFALQSTTTLHLLCFPSFANFWLLPCSCGIIFRATPSGGSRRKNAGSSRRFSEVSRRPQRRDPRLRPSRHEAFLRPRSPSLR